jgi:uncharacterized protein (TIGR00266 family)
MEINVLHQPEMAVAHLLLEGNEEVLAQAGSLIAMKGNFQTQTLLRRGSEVAKLPKTSAAQIKSLFLNSFKADDQGGALWLAPPLVGNLETYRLSQYKLIIRHSSYLASSGSIEIFVGFQSFKSQMKAEKSTWLSLFGDGLVLMSALGGLYEITVDHSYRINLDHVVAFENSLRAKILQRQKSWLLPFAAGQEILCEFKGEGKLFCQTHRPKALAKTLGPRSAHFKLSSP